MHCFRPSIFQKAIEDMENEKLVAAGGGNVQITMELNEKDDDKGGRENA